MNLPLVSEPRVVPGPRASLGEGPHWDGHTQTLLWVDIPAGTVHRFDPADGSHGVIDVGMPVGAAVPRAEGGLALAVRDGFAVLTEDRLEVVAPVTAGERPGNRMNDGACDRAGRFFAGTMSEDDTPGAGALYRLGPGRRCERVVADVSISNGVAWSPDERLMYYADTLTGRVDVFDYDPADGSLGDRRVFAVIPRGMPDGLTVDASGHVWVALWGGGAVLRLRPDGSLDLTVEIPATNVTSCAFGGPDLDVLYVTSAWNGRTGGELFRCETSLTGLPANPYRENVVP
ncbi:SMP-30/gluconolactonase/LRE family protein [Streptosporangium sp. NPDC001559]|uniref:SMP-30/gluconolactonase/LRE family protein n=1 Tax=Streptosporangium sp. NPDC001559 TaxID=3366187 RepID=UPI0036E91DB0